MNATRRNNAIPLARGLSRVEAARYVGVSPVTFDKLVHSRQMPKPKQIGARRIWDIRQVDLAFDALPYNNDGEPNPWNELLS